MDEQRQAIKEETAKKFRKDWMRSCPSRLGTWIRWRKRLESWEGIPSHDTFGRLFAQLAPGEFEKNFSSWIQGAYQKAEREEKSNEIEAIPSHREILREILDYSKAVS